MGTLYDLLISSKIVCPHCSHENSGYSNYCVNCGTLLPGKRKKEVVDSIDYYLLKKRPNISQNEYSRLKVRANRSLWEHFYNLMCDLWHSFKEILSDFWEDASVGIILFVSLFLVPCFIFIMIDKCSNHYIEIVKNDNGYGLKWDNDDLFILECKYDSILLNGTYWSYYKDGMLGLVSPNGEVLCQCEYKNVKIGKYLILVQHQDGLWDLMSIKGRKITNGHYDEIGWIYEDGKIAAVVGYYGKSESPQIGNKVTPLFSIIDGEGKPLVENCYWIYPFHQGLAAVQRSNKNNLEYVDINGKTVLPQKLGEGTSDKYSFWKNEKGDNIDPSFINDTARVYINGLKSYLFRNGGSLRVSNIGTK